MFRPTFCSRCCSATSTAAAFCSCKLASCCNFSFSSSNTFLQHHNPNSNWSLAGSETKPPTNSGKVNIGLSQIFDLFYEPFHEPFHYVIILKYNIFVLFLKCLWHMSDLVNPCFFNPCTLYLQSLYSIQTHFLITSSTISHLNEFSNP